MSGGGWLKQICSIWSRGRHFSPSLPDRRPTLGRGPTVNSNSATLNPGLFREKARLIKQWEEHVLVCLIFRKALPFFIRVLQIVAFGSWFVPIYQFTRAFPPENRRTENPAPQRGCEIRAEISES